MAENDLHEHSKDQFCRTLKAFVEARGKVTFFLGAGCSISSGIPGGGTLAKRWLEEAHYNSAAPEPLDKWAHAEGIDSANPGASYSRVMKLRFPTADGRQREIERMIGNRDPHFGYVSLAQLMADDRFKPSLARVITTNFDDLVGDALYLYTRQKPLVIRHEALAQYARPNDARRPLILKVHGDALLAPKNASHELAELPEPMAKAMLATLQHSTVIFLGYSGRDQGVLKALDSAQVERAFWVNEDPPPPKFAEWLHTTDAPVHVRHRDFDLLMATVNAVFELPEPNLIQQAEEREQRYYDTFDELTERDLSDDAGAQVALENIGSRFTGWYSVQVAAQAESTLESRRQVYENGIEEFPTSAPLLGNYANFLADEMGDFDHAETIYQSAIGADPTNATTLRNYALFLRHDRKDPDRAETAYQQAINADPTHAANLASYASFLATDLKDPGRAETAYQVALAADPTNAANLGGYASFLANHRNDPDRAETAYQQAVNADPTNATNLGNYANFLADKKGDFDRAETIYQQAIDTDPTNANTLRNYALFLRHDRKDTGRAETAYQAALAADPTNAANVESYANFLAADLNEPDRAETIYRQAIDTDPTNANTLRNYASFLATDRKDPDRAETAYQHAIDTDPTNAISLGEYASFLHEHDDLDATETAYLQAIEADPSNAANLGNYANFLHNERDDLDATEAAYHRATEADPTNAANLGNYANFLADKKGDFDHAETAYQQAIEADPTNAHNLGNYANFLATRSPDRAETAYQQAIEADPTNAHNLGNYANFAAHIRNDPTSAESLYERAIEADPSHAQNLGNYAVFAAYSLDRPDHTVRLYERAIEADPTNADNLGNYANFAAQIRNDPTSAEALYERAIDLDPQDAANLGNYAQLKLSQGQADAAEALLDRCEASPGFDASPPELHAEVAVYRLALDRFREGQSAQTALQRLRVLIEDGVRTEDWDFSAVVEFARQNQNQRLDLLQAITAVLSEDQDPLALDEFPEWVDTAQ